MDNVGHKHKTQPKGRKVDDVLKAGSKGFEPVKKDYTGYNAANAKRGNLSSAFDVDATIYGGSNNQNSAPAVQSYTIPGRETKATKQAMLASNDPVTGRSTLETYN